MWNHWLKVPLLPRYPIIDMHLPLVEGRFGKVWNVGRLSDSWIFLAKWFAREGSNLSTNPLVYVLFLERVAGSVAANASKHELKHYRRKVCLLNCLVIFKQFVGVLYSCPPTILTSTTFSLECLIWSFDQMLPNSCLDFICYLVINISLAFLVLFSLVAPLASPLALPVSLRFF